MTQPLGDRAASKGINRRSFFEIVGAAAAGSAMVGGLSSCSNGFAGGAPTLSETEQRRADALNVRIDAANLAFDRGVATHPTNGDEELYGNYIASYTKGLQHNALGEVDPNVYGQFVQALENRDWALLDTLTVGPRKLENPRGGLAFSLDGPDAASGCTMQPCPTFASLAQADDTAQVYWMSHLRDLHFSSWDGDADVAAAIADLTPLTTAGAPTVQTLFRSDNAGVRTGPFLSQFFHRDVRMGSQLLPAKQRTSVAGLDYMTDQASWLAIQNGQQAAAGHTFDPTARYLRNLRDLAMWVEADLPFQAFLNAALAMMQGGIPLASGFNVYGGSPTTAGFVTGGPPMILCVVTETALRALKACWFQKWFVHRRLRPEMMGGRVHMHMTGQANYPIHAALLNSQAVARAFSDNGTYLLSQAFPVGSPRHPSYPAGHNAIAGACGTILKAFFDTSFTWPSPMVPDATGENLVPYLGADAGQMTVGGEIDKLVDNIAVGRNAGGVHYPTEASASFDLGEQVALGMLEEMKLTFDEDFAFAFNRFDGTPVSL